MYRNTYRIVSKHRPISSLCRHRCSSLALCIFQAFFEGSMVVGIDVHHSKGFKKGSSVGGIVCSLNDTHTRYYSDVIMRKSDELFDEIDGPFRGKLIARQ